MAQYSATRKEFYPPTNSDLHEVMMLGTRQGDVIDGANPAGMAVDAFGRARVSFPLTLFDSSHRFSDNDLWNESVSGDGASAFSANEGLINMTVGTGSGAEIIRETNKVFAYQPGKSLQILQTFAFSAAQTNLRQRCGYFGAANGHYIELNDDTTYVVERSSVSGSAVETRVAQANWNIDKMDGTGQSGLTLDISKAQIMFIDIEWLGLGTVRIGFVINGQFQHVHSFHHANLVTSTYITTASLPLRYELTNTGLTGSPSTMKQVCSSVLSEGGYELRGRQQAVGSAINLPRDLPVANTEYPVISIRLKTSPDRLDAIVILTALSIMGVGNNAFFNWKVIAGGTITGGAWVSAGANSAVNYNLTGTAQSGGRTLASGFIASTNQSNSPVDILKEALFKFQLERNTFTSTAEVLTLVISTSSAGADVYASMDWEEVTR